jgi:hypothetical protein
MKAVFITRKFEEGEASTEYAKTLASAVVDEGGEAAVVSFDDGSYYSVDDRVDVYRVDMPFDGDNLFNWSMMLNNELKRQAREAFEERPDIIHVVDWTAIPGGVALSKSYEIPLVVTFQSTENERGFEGEHAEVISELEWDGAFEADLAIATSEDTKNSLLFDLDVPDEKLDFIDPYAPEWEQNVLNSYREIINHKKEVKH